MPGVYLWAEWSHYFIASVNQTSMVVIDKPMFNFDAFCSSIIALLKYALSNVEKYWRGSLNKFHHSESLLNTYVYWSRIQGMWYIRKYALPIYIFTESAPLRVQKVGVKRCLNGTLKVIRQTDTWTHRRTFRLIESNLLFTPYSDK